MSDDALPLGKTAEMHGKATKQGNLVCTGRLLDISTSTTNARKKLSIDFRGRICNGKRGCKCGNWHVCQTQALRETTFQMQNTRQKTYAMSMDRRCTSRCHSWSKTSFHLRSIFLHMTTSQTITDQ